MCSTPEQDPSLGVGRGMDASPVRTARVRSHRPACRSRPVLAERRGSAGEGALELRLRHPRAALDAVLTGLVPELVVRPPAGAPMGAQTAAPRRRDVVERRPARLARLAG